MPIYDLTTYDTCRLVQGDQSSFAINNFSDDASQISEMCVEIALGNQTIESIELVSALSTGNTWFEVNPDYLYIGHSYAGSAVVRFKLKQDIIRSLNSLSAFQMDSFFSSNYGWGSGLTCASYVYIGEEAPPTSDSQWKNLAIGKVKSGNTRACEDSTKIPINAINSDDWIYIMIYHGYEDGGYNNYLMIPRLKLYIKEPHAWNPAITLLGDAKPLPSEVDVLNIASYGRVEYLNNNAWSGSLSNTGLSLNPTYTQMHKAYSGTAVARATYRPWTLGDVSRFTGVQFTGYNTTDYGWGGLSVSSYALVCNGNDFDVEDDTNNEWTELASGVSYGRSHIDFTTDIIPLSDIDDLYFHFKLIHGSEVGDYTTHVVITECKLFADSNSEPVVISLPQTRIQESSPVFENGDSVITKVNKCISLFEEKLAVLKVNNKYIAAKAWEFTNPNNTRYDIRTHPYNSDWTHCIHLFESSMGGYIKYYEFINDYANYNLGLILEPVVYGYSGNSLNNVFIMPCALESDSIPQTITDIQNLKLFTIGYDWYVHKLCGGPLIRNVPDNFSVYTYQSDDLSFISVYNLSKIMVFATMKSIETQEPMPVILATSWASYAGFIEVDSITTGINDLVNIVDIYMGNSRSPDTINKYLFKINHDYKKCIMYNFTYKGYYSDRIFVYDGVVPAKHFIYNGTEYLNIAYNLVIKLT